jgi:hypothetical protein
MTNEERIAETVTALRADLSAYWGGSDEERKTAEKQVATLRKKHGEIIYHIALGTVNEAIANTNKNA